MAYGKIAFQSMDFQSKISNLVDVNQSLKGYGYGVGIRTMIDRNIFFQVEAMQTTYDKGSLLGVIDVKPTVSSGGVGLGFKF